MIGETQIRPADARSSSGHPLLHAAAKITAGAVLPLVLLHFDPFLLGGQDGDSLVGSLSAVAYLLMFLSMAAFLTQWMPGRRGARLSAVLAGAIFAGSLIYGLLGLAALPMSVLAVRLYGVGLLGLYPFFLSVLYFRAARSVFRKDSTIDPLRRPPVWWAFAGSVTVIVIPIFLLFAANAELNRLTAAACAGTDLSTVNWRYERYRTRAGDSDRLVRAYQRERVEPPHSALAVLYRNLTGQEIDIRLEEMAHPD